MTYTEEDVHRIHQMHEERMFRQCRIRAVLQRDEFDTDVMLPIESVTLTDDGMIVVVK